METNNEIVTDDFTKFGSRERYIVIELLTAWNEQGLPESFYSDDVKPMLNMQSGYVFLTNSDYQVAMINDGKLEVYLSTPYDGVEGFLDELVKLSPPDEYHSEDVEYIRDVAKAEYYKLPDLWK